MLKLKDDNVKFKLIWGPTTNSTKIGIFESNFHPDDEYKKLKEIVKSLKLEIEEGLSFDDYFRLMLVIQDEPAYGEVELAAVFGMINWVENDENSYKINLITEDDKSPVLFALKYKRFK